MSTNVRITIQGDGESARRALEMVRDQLDKTGDAAKRDAEKVAGAMDSIRQALTFGVVVAGLREASNAIRRMVGTSVELGVELSHMQRETGVSAQNLSVLKYASDVTGVSFEALSKGSMKLSKTMLDAEEGKSQAVRSFARLGISADEVKAKSSDLYGMMGLLADRFSTLPDGPQKAAVAIGIFGKAGAALIPFLDQGAAGIEELRGQAQALGLVLDESGVKKLEAMHQASVRMKGSLEGASLAITEGLEPAVLQLANSLQVGSQAGNGFQTIGGEIGLVVKGLATLFDMLNVSVETTAQSLYAIAQGAVDAAGLMKGILTLDDDLVSQSGKALDFHFSQTAEAMRNADKKFKDEMSALWGDHKTAPMNNAGIHMTAGAQVQLGDQSKPGKSDDSIARAATGLAEAQATAAGAAIQSGNRRMMAMLEEGHKAFLLSDVDYYRRKLQLEQGSIDAEVSAIERREAELQALYAKQHSDKLLKRNKGGNSAEELKTQQELVVLNQKLTDLAEKRATLGSVANAEGLLRADEVRLATAKMAAAVEEEKNQSITARLALVRMEGEEERKRIAASAGKDSPEYKQSEALQVIKEQKLQIGEVTRQITETENAYKRAIDELNDAASKDPRLKRAAQQEINKLNAEEAKQLTILVAQYDALAAELGGPFIETARNLHLELDKLNRPDRREDAEFGKTLVDGAEGMVKHLADAAISGRNSFRQMKEDIEKDLVDLGIKLLEQKWLTPMLMSSGARLPATNLTGAAASLLGPSAPSMTGAKPAASAAGGILSKLADIGTGGGEGGKGPSVKIMIDNTTSQAVTARQTSQSYDSDAKEWVIHTVLENAGQGGMLAHLFG